ncbi:MAG: polyphosphate kinase 2 family protein [Gammaproteobacteria bacterium]|nr:polyphosphate kinase 2 family protein [Gammaproteobacteria bacterium]
MIEAAPSRYLVPFDGHFRVAEAPTHPDHGTSSRKMRKQLRSCIDEISDLQRLLHAQDKFSLLLVFQAMDAAGKDSTIRAVMSGIDPTGCQVFSFKKPSTLELDHDFLWRSAVRLPERGRIGIFNRSYYEEVLVVRVHPEYLKYQRLPDLPDALPDNFWEQRFESIRDHEKHLARNGTVILKFWLNVSQEEQHRRFLSRIETQEKNWKFSHGDLVESSYWDSYMNAYQDALNNTSRNWAPWYSIPADDKPYMRLQVARVLLATLQRLPLAYPQMTPEERERLSAARSKLIV